MGVRRTSTFDVICAGEALWDLNTPPGVALANAASLRFRPGGGAVNAALALGREGFRVGLAASLGDDALGRALCAKLESAGIDIGGVSFAPPRTGLVFVEAIGAARRVVAYRAEDATPVSMPAGWQAQLLLLSGLSPVVEHAAALCKAARAARRAGTIIVIDINARRRLWAGHDARTIRALLREADVVRCSTEDLAVLGLDTAAVRGAMRRRGVLVSTDGAGMARVMGPFGDIAQAPQVIAATDPTGAGDAFTAAVCAALVRAGDSGPERVDLWDRALKRGHAAARARIQRRTSDRRGGP